MLRSKPRFLPAVALVALATIWIAAGQSARPYTYTTKNGEWPSYTGDVRGTKYSPLVMAWLHRTGHAPTPMPRLRTVMSPS